MFLSGWLVLGSSQVKSNGSATLPLVGPYSETFQITASPTGGLSFGPSSLSTKTGLALITFVDGANAQHTLNFQETNTLWPGLVVNKQGEKLEGRIFFPSAGDYTYFCAVPGHEAAGMHGIVHVTGPTMTLQQAEAAAGKVAGQDPRPVHRALPGPRAESAGYGTRTVERVAHGFHARPAAVRPVRRRRRRPSAPTGRVTRARPRAPRNVLTSGFATCVPLKTFGKFMSIPTRDSSPTT